METMTIRESPQLVYDIATRTPTMWLCLKCDQVIPLHDRFDHQYGPAENCPGRVQSVRASREQAKAWQREQARGMIATYTKILSDLDRWRADLNQIDRQSPAFAQAMVEAYDDLIEEAQEAPELSWSRLATLELYRWFYERRAAGEYLWPWKSNGTRKAITTRGGA